MMKRFVLRALVRSPSLAAMGSANRPPTCRAGTPCRPRRRPTCAPPITGPASTSASTAAAASAVRISSTGFTRGAFDTSRRPRRRHGRLQLSDGPDRVRRSKATSTGATSAAARPAAAPTLRNPQQLAEHRARPPRLRLRPLHALRHRRRRLRRHQDLGRRRRRYATTPRPAGRSAAASKRRSPARGPPRSNISMSISATPEPQCRRRHANFHTEYRARRHQLPVLIARHATRQMQSPGVRSGAFACA